MRAWAIAPLEWDGGRYRYTLERAWLPGPRGRSGRACFVMLNPSTADAFTDDPTVRRCVGFAQRIGASELVVVNLYALRATRPADLFRADPAAAIGPNNDAVILEQALRAHVVIAGWGNHGQRHGRGAAVRAMLERSGVRLHHLGLTGAGHPRHPLYLPRTTPLEEWRP